MLTLSVYGTYYNLTTTLTKGYMMKTSPQNVIACLAGDLLVDEMLVIEAIREEEEVRAIFRDTVEDFTEYSTLLNAVGGLF